jgi:ATP-dependent RNA helicase DDX27
MNLSRPVLKGLTTLGFTAPTVIQARAIPLGLMGKDIVGGAITGSGKTMAFMVPILERLLFRPKANPLTRVLILMPTRELALQCHSVACKVAQYTDITFALAIGGLNIKMQEAELKRQPDIVIATPGRLIDFIHNSSSFTLDSIEILVMDEADRCGLSNVFDFCFMQRICGVTYYVLCLECWRMDLRMNSTKLSRTPLNLVKQCYFQLP